MGNKNETSGHSTKKISPASLPPLPDGSTAVAGLALGDLGETRAVHLRVRFCSAGCTADTGGRSCGWHPARENDKGRKEE